MASVPPHQARPGAMPATGVVPSPLCAMRAQAGSKALRSPQAPPLVGAATPQAFWVILLETSSAQWGPEKAGAVAAAHLLARGSISGKEFDSGQSSWASSLLCEWVAEQDIGLNLLLLGAQGRHVGRPACHQRGPFHPPSAAQLSPAHTQE